MPVLTPFETGDRPMHSLSARQLPASSHALLRSLLVLACGAALLSPLSSCRSSHWKHRAVYVESGIGVYTEAYFDDEGQRVPQGFAHPIEISDRQIAILLARLGYVKKRFFLDNATGHLLTPEQIEMLAPPIAESLRKLGPDERLRFLACDVDSLLGFFREVQGTSGVIFAPDEDRIDIAFDMIDEEVMTGTPGNLRSVRFYGQPTEIAESSLSVVPMRGAANHVDPQTGQRYPLWVTIPRSQIDAIVTRTLAEAEVARQAAQAVEAEKKAATNGPPSSQKEAPTAATVTPPPPAPTQAGTTSAGDSPPPRVGPVADVEPASSGDAPVEKLAFELEGCQVYKHGDVYYALPPSEGDFDLEKARTKGYDLLFKGEHLAAIRDAIEEAKAAGLFE